MKNITFFSLFFCVVFLRAQVGVNTTNPKATLDIVAKDSIGTATDVDGLVIPRVDRQRALQMVNIPTSTLIYVNDASTGSQSGKAQNIDAEGFYYYDGIATEWAKLTRSSASVQNLCNGFQGTYVHGAPVSLAVYRVTIENNSFSPVTMNLQPSDLVLSGVSGLTVGTPTATNLSGGMLSLASGAQAIIDYPISGIPTTDGILTGTWTKISLSCTQTQLVGKGTATFTFPQNLFVASVNLGGTGDVQGVVDNAANKLTMNVPYTAGKGIYDAYQSPWIQNNSGTGQGGDTNSFRISYPAGTFSTSGNIPVTIEVDGDGSFNALKLARGNSMVLATLPFAHNGNPSDGDIILNIVTCGAFMGPGNTNFKGFMCHNLGADMSVDPFVPSAVIHGAKYQWGAQTNQSGRYISQADDQANSGPVSGWQPSGSDLPNGTWSNTKKTVNDPCPIGFRVPTFAQWSQVVNSSNNTITRTGTWTESSSNYSSGITLGKTLFLPAAGYRDPSVGSLGFRGSAGYYWSSTQGNYSYAGYMTFYNVGDATTINGHYGRTVGFSIRCVSE